MMRGTKGEGEGDEEEVEEVSPKKKKTNRDYLTQRVSSERFTRVGEGTEVTDGHACTKSLWVPVEVRLDVEVTHV